MSISDLFQHIQHKRNLSHFAAIVNIASVDGVISEEEQELLERFAKKLDVTEDEVKAVLKNPNVYPITPPDNNESRFRRLYDLFKIVYADHKMDEKERLLVERYAVGLGFNFAKAIKIINKTVKIFEGELELDEYIFLVSKDI
ncbi:MAG: TerB family tellurite resistance protein [Flavobacteriaceae bacterium]|nr:TerB family tellurite resistance protein [Flavobacteriaceae bacterium]